MDHPLLALWYEQAFAQVPSDVQIWDAHSHTGQADPDGVTNTAAALLEALAAAGHAGAVVCSSADPAGYRAANDRILDETAASGGRLIPFLRVDPNAPGAVAEAIRCLDAGHRGIKLHPRSDAFSLADPAVAELARVAAERRAPLLVHAGRGMEPLGEAPLRLLEDHPGLHIVLAHCAISDLARLGPASSRYPGLLFDTAWWNPVDLAALLGWVDTGQLLYASDLPYGAPRMSGTITARAAIHAGLSASGLGALFGGNLTKILAGEAPVRLGTAPSAPADPLLARVAANLFGAIGVVVAGGDSTQPVELAMRATEAGPGDHSGLLAAIRTTLGAALDVWATQRRTRFGLLVVACSAALTPGAGHPEL